MMEEKEKVEGFIEKSVKELKKLWEESEEEAIKKKGRNEFFSFFSSLAFPEISSSLLEKVSNKFLKEFDWKKFEEREYLGADLGFFLSAFLKKSIENCILPQEKKGINKEGNIKPIDVRLNIKKLPVCLDYLGYQNPKKLHLIIEGNCGWGTGYETRGGKVIIEGNCGDLTGAIIEDGKIIVKGSCGDWTGYKMKGGEVIVEGDCEYWTGSEMKGGKLIVKGKVKTFDESTFFWNQGIIIVRKSKIWKKGNWTREGREMLKRNEISVERGC